MKKALLLVSIYSLIVTGYLVFRLNNNSAVERRQSEVVDRSEYSLLAKRIFVENPNDMIINFVPLRQQLREYVADQNIRMGVFFDYLPTGTSIGINDKEEFFRASLVKTPLIMKTYKLIEEGKLKENDILTIKEENIDILSGELWKKGVGATLTIDEAVRETMVNSDNTAYQVLKDKVSKTSGGEYDEDFLNEVYDYIDIPRELDSETEYITPKNYSSLLRSLFFSAYLSYENSDKILNYLSESPDDALLAAPITSGIKVAHKIGVYNFGNGAEQTHSDCGIIYLPNRPYILCIMTNADAGTSKRIFPEISKIVFDYISSVNN